MTSTLYIFVGSLLIWALYRLSQVGKRPKGYPPGPPTIPVLGNLHQMPLKDPHLQFQKWAQEYGPVYSVILGTKVMIVLSKDQVIKDLVDKRSAIYSSRPDLYIGQTVLSGGHRMLITPYGPTYRLQRKVAHTALNVRKSETYIPYQEIEAKQMLYDIMQNPSGLLEQFRRFGSSLATSIIYGFRWKTFDDPRLQLFFHLIDEFAEINATGGAAFADFFPILRYIPTALYPIKKRAQQHHKNEKILYKDFWYTAKHAITNKLPSARSCACMDILDMQKQEGFNDDFAIYISSTIFEAGSDTTASELYAFAQAMLLYPEVQRKGQAEIDALLGEDRWPTLEDAPRLPYVRACIKETLRWMPTTILGAAPHALTENDQYMGYHLPAGAMVMLNVWTIHRDAERHPEPEKFMPERYLGDDTNSYESFSAADVSKRDHFSFGAGRRVCPGSHVADRSMFLIIARFLWAFNIKPKIGNDGKPNLPKQDDFVQGMVVIPKTFEALIEPRSQKRAEMVRSQWQRAQQELDDDGQFLKNPI